MDIIKRKERKDKKERERGKNFFFCAVSLLYNNNIAALDLLNGRRMDRSQSLCVSSAELLPLV